LHSPHGLETEGLEGGHLGRHMVTHLESLRLQECLVPVKRVRVQSGEDATATKSKYCVACVS
jgi:hypothetical protein